MCTNDSEDGLTDRLAALQELRCFQASLSRKLSLKKQKEGESSVIDCPSASISSVLDYLAQLSALDSQPKIRPDVAAMDDPPIAPKQKPRRKYSRPTRGIKTRSTARRANAEDPASCSS